jgi:hypothetical protein
LGNRAKPNIHDITRSLEHGGVEISTFKHYLQTNVNETNIGKRIQPKNAALTHIFKVKKTSRYFKASKKKSTMENIPEFLPSDNEDSDEDMDDHTTEGGVPTYVPRHLPAFPNKHSFRQTPVKLLYINSKETDGWTLTIFF